MTAKNDRTHKSQQELISEAVAAYQKKYFDGGDMGRYAPYLPNTLIVWDGRVVILKSVTFDILYRYCG